MVWINIEDLVASNPPSPREAQEVFDNLAKHAKARFYADENFPPNATAILRSRARVVTAQEAGLIGHPDENHITYARKNGRVLVTCDRDFLDERRHPLIHCPAIFVFDFGSGSVAEIRQAFRCLNDVLSAPQFYDKWSKTDAKRNSWSEYMRHQDGSTSRSRSRVWRGKLQEWVNDRGAIRKTTHVVVNRIKHVPIKVRFDNGDLVPTIDLCLIATVQLGSCHDRIVLQDLYARKRDTITRRDNTLEGEGESRSHVDNLDIPVLSDN